MQSSVSATSRQVVAVATASLPVLVLPRQLDTSSTVAVPHYKTRNRPDAILSASFVLEAKRDFET